MINRHSNYHQFARYIKETIEAFGTMYTDGYNAKMYHGINKQMIFNGTMAEIQGPVSTSVDEMVAIRFSRRDVLIVELMPDVVTKYFVGNWISPYPDEQEILLGFSAFGGMLHFQNRKSGMGDNYKYYILMLRMTENMTGGQYFMFDPSNILQNTTRNDSWIENERNVEMNKLGSLEDTHWKIFGILICHE